MIIIVRISFHYSKGCLRQFICGGIRFKWGYNNHPEDCRYNNNAKLKLHWLQATVEAATNADRWLQYYYYYN